MVPDISRTIAIVVAFSAIAFVFTSGLIINIEHTAQASSLRKDIDKILKDVKKKLKDKNNDEKDDDEKDDDEKDDDEKEAKNIIQSYQ